MKLKLMAPFEIEAFAMRASRIMENPDDYESAWYETFRIAERHPERIVGERPRRLGVTSLEAVRFTHVPAERDRRRSRYRTIDTHSLRRPLHAIELVVRPAERWWVRNLASSPGESAVSAALEEALTSRSVPPPVLVRLHDHRIGLLELDLPVPEALLHQRESPVSLEEALDGLQGLGIALVEDLVQDIAGEVVDPLIEWLREEAPIGRRYLLPRSSPGDSAALASDPTTLWVTRSIVVEVRSSGHRAVVARHWLKDVEDATGRAGRCATDPDAWSTSWLNYFFGERSYDGAYPEDGWVGSETPPPEDRARRLHVLGGAAGAAGAFNTAWEALLIAQYYYAAFDRLQTRISRILAVSVAGEQRRSVSAVQAELDGAIRDAQMLKVDFDENRKYYARRVASSVDEVLEGWGFERGLRARVDARIEDCAARLNELHTRSIERSGVYTDVILIAIGVSAVFEVLLVLATYGRTMSADPYLQAYDRGSWINVAAWLGGSSTDAILIAASFFSLGLIALYAFVRMSRSRV